MTFFYACFLFAERDVGSAVAAPACPASSVGQSHVAENARVDPFELMASGARGNLPNAEVPEGVNALSEPVDRETEMSREHPLTIEVLSEKEVGTVVPPSTLGRN